MTLSEDDVNWDGPLPIVLVLDHGDNYVYVDQGDGAEARAAEWAGIHQEYAPFTFSVHDERCPNCNRTYWHEAPTGSRATGWHCPLCDAPLYDQESREHANAVNTLPEKTRKLVLDALRVRGMDFVADRLDNDGAADEAADAFRALVGEHDGQFDPDQYGNEMPPADDDGEVFVGTVIANARRKFADASEEDLRSLFVEIREALEGDSNDAEHDALEMVADYFGIPHVDPEY